MKHPSTTIRLKSDEYLETLYKERVYTWKDYHRVLRDYREKMDEAVADLFIEVEA